MGLSRLLLSLILFSFSLISISVGICDAPTNRFDTCPVFVRPVEWDGDSLRSLLLSDAVVSSDLDLVPSLVSEELFSEDTFIIDDTSVIDANLDVVVLVPVPEFVSSYYLDVGVGSVIEGVLSSGVMYPGLVSVSDFKVSDSLLSSCYVEFGDFYSRLPFDVVTDNFVKYDDRLTLSYILSWDIVNHLVLSLDNGNYVYATLILDDKIVTIDEVLGDGVTELYRLNFPKLSGYVDLVALHDAVCI